MREYVRCRTSAAVRVLIQHQEDVTFNININRNSVEVPAATWAIPDDDDMVQHRLDVRGLLRRNMKHGKLA